MTDIETSTRLLIAKPVKQQVTHFSEAINDIGHMVELVQRTVPNLPNNQQRLGYLREALSCIRDKAELALRGER